MPRFRATWVSRRTKPTFPAAAPSPRSRPRGERGTVTERKEPNPEQMTEEELARANGEALPDRHALTVMHGIHPLPQPVVIEPVLDPAPVDDPSAAS